MEQQKEGKERLISPVISTLEERVHADKTEAGDPKGNDEERIQSPNVER